MGNLLIDACGWVALMEGDFNIDSALSQLVGPPHFILIDLVLEELEALDSERPRGKKLMLDLLLQRSTRLEHEQMHTDNALLEVAIALKIPILTVDSNLKRQSLENGVGIIEVLQGKNLRLINGL